MRNRTHPSTKYLTDRLAEELFLSIEHTREGRGVNNHGIHADTLLELFHMMNDKGIGWLEAGQAMLRNVNQWGPRAAAIEADWLAGDLIGAARATCMPDLIADDDTNPDPGNSQHDWFNATRRMIQLIAKESVVE